MTTIDPNAAATGDGIFGLPHTPAEARVVLLPVPFEATTSLSEMLDEVIPWIDQAIKDGTI